MSSTTGVRRLPGIESRPPTDPEWSAFDSLESSQAHGDCESMRPWAPPVTEQLYCTLDKGHQGPHVGHGGGKAMGVWSQDGSWGYKRNGEEF